MIEDKKISPNKGVGIIFEHNDKKCVTLPRINVYDFEVDAHIQSYAGLVWYASHFHASLHVHDLRCKIVDDETEQLFNCNTQPKMSQFKRVDVKAPAKKDWYEDKRFGGKFLVLKKGDYTTRFNNIYDCVEAVELTFNSVFGKPWILRRNLYDEPWEESKAKIIKMYSKLSDQSK